MDTQPGRAINIFMSYAQEDTDLKRELNNHLTALDPRHNAHARPVVRWKLARPLGQRACSAGFAIAITPDFSEIVSLEIVEV